MYILTMLKIETIKEIIEKHKQEISEKYHISEIGIFGSYTRGEQEADSDIDILVSFDKPIGFIKFMRLEFYLSELLGKKVDLVTKDSLKPHIGSIILKETQYV
jgi:predicted nucleotidyltransferase